MDATGKVGARLLSEYLDDPLQLGLLLRPVGEAGRMQEVVREGYGHQRGEREAGSG